MEGGGGAETILRLIAQKASFCRSYLEWIVTYGQMQIEEKHPLLLTIENHQSFHNKRFIFHNKKPV